MNTIPGVGEIKTALAEPAQEVMARYPTNRSAIMPTLELAQSKYGMIDGSVYQAVAELLDVPEIWVFEVASFYTMFDRTGLGKYNIQICTNVSCMLRDAYGLLDYLKQRLEIDTGETTSDGMFTLSAVECLGACDKAPAMMVNEAYHEDLTREMLDELILSLSETAAEVAS